MNENNGNENIGTIQPDPPQHRGVSIGDILGDRYLIEDVIAEGGMGVVYRAVDNLLLEKANKRRQVAIKVLGEQIRSSPLAWMQLIAETERTIDLTHENIIKVSMIGHDAKLDEYFMVMEYLEGKSLQQEIDERPGQPLPKEEALRIVEGVGRALEFAHSRKPKSVIHWDIKPNNVFLTKEGKVKVLDFGIAQAILEKGEQEGEVTRFVKDCVVASAYTTAYASCETIHAALTGMKPQADPRDDIYALACVAYKLLAGAHPFGREGEAKGALFARSQKMTPKPIKGLSSRQRRALAKGLAFDREKRTATVNEFLDGMTASGGMPWPKIAAAVLVLAVAVGLAAWKFAPLLTLQASPEQQAQNEREAMALLAQMPADPKSPGDLVDEATDIRLRLTDRRLLQYPAVKAKLNALVDGFLNQGQQALSRGDAKAAGDYLSLAEALNSDTAMEGRLREARKAIKAAASGGAQTGEQR
jgi:serine/threonine protein kinase